MPSNERVNRVIKKTWWNVTFLVNVTFSVVDVTFFRGRSIFFTAGQFFGHMTRKSIAVPQGKKRNICH